jgi:hypothetical protein
MTWLLADPTVAISDILPKESHMNIITPLRETFVSERRRLRHFQGEIQAENHHY